MDSPTVRFLSRSHFECIFSLMFSKLFEQDMILHIKVFLQDHDIAFRHKEANHLLIRQGNKFSYVLVPSLPSNSEEELDLCFTDHSSTKWDPTTEQCCLREVDHVHAHVHNGDLVEDILLEEVLTLRATFQSVLLLQMNSFCALS